MGILKKIKAGTLVETLVGTTIIVIIFTVATLVLNNVFKNVMKNNTIKIDNHLSKLYYLYKHQKIKLPYQDDFEDWEILIQDEQTNNQKIIIVKAENKQTKKTRITTYQLNEEIY